MARRNGTNAKQTGLWDREVKDEALVETVATIAEHRENAKAFGKANRDLKAQIKGLKPAPKDGERLRIGEYVVTMKTRAGGGFDIPKWERITVGGIAVPVEEQ